MMETCQMVEDELGLLQLFYSIAVVDLAVENKDICLNTTLHLLI